MPHPLDAALRDPWQLLDTVLDGPLHPGGEEATADLLDRAGVDGGTRLLDVGCGAGDALRLARDRGARAVGLDREPTTPGAVRGDLTALPFRDDSFDVVLGECVLCLSPDLDRTLRDVERVLKPGGRLALSDVTVSGELPAVPSPLDDVLCLDGPRDREHLRGGIESAGFEVDDLRTHREDLLAMRDRLRERVDYERLLALLGDRGDDLRAGVDDLRTAVEAGDIGYVSIVATTRPETASGPDERGL